MSKSSLCNLILKKSLAHHFRAKHVYQQLFYKMLPFHNVVCSIMCFRVLNFILAVCVLTIFRFICLSSLSHRLGENGKSQGFIYVVSRNPLGVVKICDKMSQQSIQPVSRQFIKSQKIAVQSAEFILWGSKILVRSSMTRLIL